MECCISNCIFSNCKVQSKYRPSDSKSNQGRFNNKVLNGSVCQMKCASYPKKPFKHTKMECKCTSNSRFKVFKNLKELIQNGPKPMDLLFKSCSWYDASNKKSKTAVIPINGMFLPQIHLKLSNLNVKFLPLPHIFANALWFTQIFNE